MRKLRIYLLIVIASIFFICAQHQEALSGPGPLQIDFFYSPSCHSCRVVEQEVLPKLKERYQDKIAINYYNIDDAGNAILKLFMEEEYGVSKGRVPAIFLQGLYLEGQIQIKRELANAIEKILAENGSFSQPEKEPLSVNKLILNRFSNFSPAVITVAGLVDGINPCAFATMVFFISFLTLNNYRRRQIIYIGGAFILAVFLTYLALGLGIFQALKKLQVFAFLSQLVYYLIALLALGLGIYALCDYIRYKRTAQTTGCSLRLYNRLRSLADSQKGLVILIIGAFVNGFIIALLESVCTGQVYFPTIAFVLRIPNLRLHALFYLILYNSAFILPLIGVFLLTYKGLTSEKLAAFSNRHLGAIKLATAFLFFGLAGLLLVL